MSKEPQNKVLDLVSETAGTISTAGISLICATGAQKGEVGVEKGSGMQGEIVVGEETGERF